MSDAYSQKPSVSLFLQLGTHKERICNEMHSSDHVYTHTFLQRNPDIKWKGGHVIYHKSKRTISLRLLSMMVNFSFVSYGK